MAASELHTGERPGLIARARDILIRPQTEWRRIAAEDPAPLMGSYVVPLALLGAVVGFAADVLYTGAFSVSAALVSKAVSALFYFVFAVLGVGIAARLINALAPRFGAEANSDRAMQLAAYSATPIFVGALFAVAPPIAAMMMGAGVIYALILLAMGVQPLLALDDPGNSAPRFTLSIAGLALLIALLTSMFAGPLIHSGREALIGAVETVVPPPAAAPVIVRRSAAEVAIDRLAQSEAGLLLSDPARLEEQFPDSLPGGFARQSVTKAQGGGVSRADGVYRRGDVTLSVVLIQFSANVESQALAELLEVKPGGPTEGGYNRTQTIDGRFYAEEVRETSSRYVVIGHGVILISEGGVTMDQARAAVETIGLQRLEGLFGR
ncbi:MAG: Yip1 family protein [Hyphomonadaceae bacterium]